LAKAVLALAAVIGGVIFYLYSLQVWPAIIGSIAAIALAIFFLFLFYDMFKK